MSKELIQAVYPGPMIPKGAIGWHRNAYDADIDHGAAELVAENVVQVQLAVAGTLKIDSGSAADTTQTVYIRGIDNNDKQIIESKMLTGQTALAVSTTVWKYVECAWLDANCAGAVIVTDSSNATICTITIGQMSTYIMQHFTGEYTGYLTGLWCGPSANATPITDGGVNFDLRWYPDDQSSDADFTDGYISLAQPAISVELVTDLTFGMAPPPMIFPQPIRLPPGGWLALFAQSIAANNFVWAMMQGYDVLE